MPPDTFTSPFLFTLCQPGAESALKSEISREHPDLRFAYSRPGFVTFKHENGEAFKADFILRSVFARAYGLSFGKVSEGDLEKGLEFVKRLTTAGARVCWHVTERDLFVPGDEPLGYQRGAWIARARQAFLDALPAKERHQLDDQSAPKTGDKVLDLIAVEENEWWFGLHQHNARHSSFPGGRPQITLPADAPSRAYLKIEEAIRLSGFDVRANDTAVEIGSAPGGASFALLERGLNVIGIDPGAMDPRILAHPKYKHFDRPVNRVAREELPEHVHWLLLDMNVAPSVTLFAVDRLAHRLQNSLLGVFLTIKLNQWKIADEIPGMLAHVREMGITQVRARQLSSNRQEFTLYGLTRKGAARAMHSNRS